MSGERQPARRVTLPSSQHQIVDLKYGIKDLVDRTHRGRDAHQKIVLDFDIYRRLIDNVRGTIEDKMGPEVSADPAIIVTVVLTLLTSEELLVKHVYDSANAAPTDDAEWRLITETFAWRLLGRYNREILSDLGEEEDDQ